MSRHNDGSGGNFIDVGDPSGAKFQREDAWTAITFFRIASSNTDDNGFISMWESGVAQFLLRTDNQAAPTNVEFFGGTTSPSINGASSINLDTWYLTAAICDGTVGANDLTLYTFNMDGTVIDDGLTGTHSGNFGTTSTNIQLMTRESASDNIDGDQAHSAYFKSVLTKQDVLNYLRNPMTVVAQKRLVGGVSWYFPLDGRSSPEVDLSGSGETGTLNGTLTVTDNPPTSIFGLDNIIPFPTAGGAPSGSVIPINLFFNVSA